MVLSNNIYEPIDLSEYIQTGEGGTAFSYTHKTRNILAKLYKPGFEAERAVEEFLTACTVYEIGIPTPKPIRLITDGECYGAEYELIGNKRSFARVLSEEPGRLDEITNTFVRKTKELHSSKADTTRIKSYKERVTRFYKEKNLVPPVFRERALAFLEKVPDTPTCLHGDLQIGNIITDGDRILWIDVGEFSYGAPEWDLSLMWTICNNIDVCRADRTFHITPEMLNAHWGIFLRAYLGTSDSQTLEAFTKRLLPFYAAKLPYVYDMAYHGSLSEAKSQMLLKLL